jgi:hypothetical protein
MSDSLNSLTDQRRKSGLVSDSSPAWFRQKLPVSVWTLCSAGSHRQILKNQEISGTPDYQDIRRNPQTVTLLRKIRRSSFEKFTCKMFQQLLKS